MQGTVTLQGVGWQCSVKGPWQLHKAHCLRSGVRDVLSAVCCKRRLPSALSGVLKRKEGLNQFCLFWLNSILNQKLSKTLEDWDVHFAVKWAEFCNVEGSAQNCSEHNCSLRGGVH